MEPAALTIDSMNAIRASERKSSVLLRRATPMLAPAANIGRSASTWLGYRTLDLQRHGDLFAGLVVLDFDFLLGQRFAAGQRVLADLLPQSVVGRAQNGHG